MSKDAVAVATLIGSLFMVKIMGGVVLGQVRELLHICFGYMVSGGPNVVAEILPTLFKTVALSFVTMAGPFLAVTALLAVGVTFFQTKMLVAGESIKPKFSRINPLEGFKRLFGALLLWFNSI